MAAGLAFRLVARGVKHEDAKGRRFFGGGAGRVGHGRSRKITEDHGKGDEGVGARGIHHEGAKTTEVRRWLGGG